jgi:lipoprotein-anchoring transpeptidase ErfK/SrfK
MTWRHRLIAFVLAAGPLLGIASTAHAQSGSWIDINLSSQTATAYEGDTPIKTVGVTTGRPGFATPTGTFSIQSRIANETMSSASIGIPIDSPGGYYLQNVFYTQYFDGSGDAIHANWWSPPGAFGSYPTSHGCVGMTTNDAAWFWNFADYGTPVVIHY